MKQDVVGYAKSMATYDDNEWLKSGRSGKTKCQYLPKKSQLQIRSKLKSLVAI